jgi:hypothetical protein
MREAERDDICAHCGENIYAGFHQIGTNPFDSSLKPPWIHKECVEALTKKERERAFNPSSEPTKRAQTNTHGSKINVSLHCECGREVAVDRTTLEILKLNAVKESARASV